MTLGPGGDAILKSYETSKKLADIDLWQASGMSFAIALTER